MGGRKHRFYENRMLKKWFGCNRRLDVQGKGGCDGKNEWLSIELCQRLVPKWIKKELKQAEEDNRDDKTNHKLMPILVVREKYKPDREAFVITRLKDWNEHFGK